MRSGRRLSGWLGHGLLALVLLVGAVDLHVQEALEPLGPAGESLYYPGAAHQGQPVHVEKADPVERPHCAACLHHLQTRGAHLQPVSSALPADLTFHLWPAPAPSASRIARSPFGARGPPLS
jgi:hypothetical protein